MMPGSAMVLAAGLGKRMRGHADGLPKPLMEVGGETLIDRALDRLADAGVATCVVNLHYRADVVRGHLDKRVALGKPPAVVYSDETDALLETGGGLVRALPLLGDGAFFVANGDVLWRDRGRNAFVHLAEHWDDGRMDALLLLHPRETAIGMDGTGDYALNEDGSIVRAQGGAPAPYFFTGLRMMHPRLLADAPRGAFSVLELFDRAERAGRLHGLVHEGEWMHVGSPEGLAQAEAALAQTWTKA